MSDLSTQINELKAANARILAEHQPKLTDTSIPLEDRWSIFEQLSELGILPEKTYGDGHIRVLAGAGPELSMYDDFHVDRHETMSYVDMLDVIRVKIEDEDESFEQVDVDAWREAVLEAGHGKFTYDW